MKTSTKIIVGIIILIVVAIVIFFAFFNKAQAPENTNVTATTTPWKTYTIKNVTVSAPADLTLDIASLLSGTGAKVLIPKVPPYFHTHLINEAYINLSKPAKTCTSSAEEIISRKPVTLDVVNFARTEWSGVGAGNLYQGIDYSTTINGLCYQAELFTHSANGEGLYTGDTEQIKRVDAQQAEDIKNLFALFDQIASTVKFMK